jgi:6-phosphofructokinase 1
MVALQAGTIVTVPLDEACSAIKTVPVDGQLVRTARDIGISFAAPRDSKFGEEAMYEVRTSGHLQA